MMEMPDFTKPRKGWRRTEVNGQTLYLPRGLTYHRSTRWRTAVNSQRRYFPSLAKAWEDLCERRGGDPDRWEPRAPNKKKSKKFETGVSGVIVLLAKRGRNFFVHVSVSQPLTIGYRVPYVDRIRLDEISQQWLDQRLCEATAVRWHYVKVRNEGLPHNPVRLEDVDPACIPRTPVKRISVDELFAEADRRTTTHRD